MLGERPLAGQPTSHLHLPKPAFGYLLVETHFFFHCRFPRWERLLCPVALGWTCTPGPRHIICPSSCCSPSAEHTHSTSKASHKCWARCLLLRRSLSAYIQWPCLGSLDVLCLDIISRRGKGCAQKPQTFYRPTQDLPQSDSSSSQRSPEDGAHG